MKASVCECEQPAFKPFCIKIEFQSESEAAQFYGLLNTSKVCEVVPKVSTDSIRRAMEAGIHKPNSYGFPGEAEARSKLDSDLRARYRA